MTSNLFNRVGKFIIDSKRGAILDLSRYEGVDIDRFKDYADTYYGLTTNKRDPNLVKVGKKFYSSFIQFK